MANAIRAAERDCRRGSPRGSPSTEWDLQAALLQRRSAFAGGEAAISKVASSSLLPLFAGIPTGVPAL